MGNMADSVDWIRGFEQSKKRLKKIHFKFQDIGPSTKETSDKLYKLYLMMDKYQEGKTFEELLDEANDPIFFSRKE